MKQIIHVWSHMTGPGNSEASENTERRLALARETWRIARAESARFNIYWTTFMLRRNPFDSGHDGLRRKEYAAQIYRDSTDIGDPRPVAYVKDMLDWALKASLYPDDILLFSNSDVCLAPDMGAQIADKVHAYGAVYTHRYDYQAGELNEPQTIEQIRKQSWYPGSDLFAFSADWWASNAQAYPDMLAGREWGDCVLRNLVKKTGGVEIHSRVYHENHVSDWENPELKAVLPGNLHNKKLAEEFFAKHGGDCNDWIQ